MTGLTSDLLGRACRVFLSRAYPDRVIPASKRCYFELAAGQPLEPVLVPPVCQVLTAADGGIRGYALRLGSAVFPHVKLQVIDCGQPACVFAVDTHDALKVHPDHPDAGRWAQIQEANHRLKEEIELAWEAEGLLTFNGLLRDGLARGSGQWAVGSEQ